MRVSSVQESVQTERVVDVVIDPRSGGAQALYTYKAAEGIKPGDGLIVPLGTRSTLGFALEVYEASEQDLGFPFRNLKQPSGSVRGVNLPAHLVDLARFVAEEYLCSLPIAFSASIPPSARDRLVTAWTLKNKEGPLTPMQQEVIRFLEESGGTIYDTKTKKLPAATTRALRLMKGKGLVEQSTEIHPFGERKGGERLLRLSADEKRIEMFLTKEGKRKPAQALTLMRLQVAERSSFSPGEIKSLAGVTDATLKALEEAGLLEMTTMKDQFMAHPPQPNRYQTLAIEAIADAIQSREQKGFLLYGITGSGKTEVYLRAAAEALRMGRQVLYLVPEIALAAQGIGRLRERFGSKVAVLHSDLPNSERLKNWMRSRNGEASVVLGARSALFAPLDNLGLIIVDEEHEASYKQESAPRYHSKTIAMKLGGLHQCPVVLGSATPSIESFWEADNDRLTLLTLPERAASAQLPEVHVDDLAQGYREGRPALICDDLHHRIEETLKVRKQVILFLNRRAYSPFVICRDCGFQARCKNCAVSLSYHRQDRRLRCHHCGYSERPPDICPKCQGLRISAFGVGTEKVEEAVATTFPTARVARLDRDIARKKGALEEIFARFRCGDIDILVGTQMVAKGLDFPNVTLVGVIAADMSLNIPDFRAGERTFQLLSQVAGRAGRGKSPGNVVIQTFNPQHPAVLSAQTHNYVAFYEGALVERQDAGYPPFRRLVNVTFSGFARSAVITASTEAAEKLQEVADLELLGPVDCALERLQNRWRRHVLLKLPQGASPKGIGEALLGFGTKDLHVLVDVDPYSLM
jgi:primosomal protein N' (replication factor Y) (superfamily II helicase)